MGIESPAETIVSAGLFKRKIIKEKKQREKICWYRYQDADSAAFIFPRRRTTAGNKKQPEHALQKKAVLVV